MRFIIFIVILILGSTKAALTHEIANQNFTYNNIPIPVNCFGWDQPEDLKKCKWDIPFDKYENQKRIKDANVYGVWYANKDDSEHYDSYDYYQPIGVINKNILVIKYIDYAGGSYEFPTIYQVKRESDNLLPVKSYTPDCSYGDINADVKQGKLVIKKTVSGAQLASLMHLTERHPLFQDFIDSFDCIFEAEYIDGQISKIHMAGFDNMQVQSMKDQHESFIHNKTIYLENKGQSYCLVGAYVRYLSENGEKDFDSQEAIQFFKNLLDGCSPQ